MKFVIACFLLFCLTTADDFATFKSEMEGKVQQLATQMETIFGRRCENSIATCEVLSYNQCEGTDTKQCFEQFPKPVDCLSDGAYLSKTSAIRFPNDIDTASLSKQEKQFVCTSALMEDKFQELNNGRNKRYGKAYIGTSLGAFRSYPASRQLDQSGNCIDFDPRYRPWYVTATSGAKNVILMIDTSGSMFGDRLQIAKDAATAVINTLSNSDFIGVISFGSTASTLFANKIKRATSENKQSIISQIDALEASGQTNYQAALNKAFAKLNAAQSDEYGAPCSDGENILLFLTDGQPTVGLSTSAQLIDLIDGKNTNVTLFTYALGSGADTTILQDLACEYSGIMFEIADSGSDSELTTTMRGYYTYISEGVTISSPVWTEPYQDAFGFGKLVTVSMPIYYEQSGIRSILGVAGIDVLWEQIQFGQTEEDVIKRLISNAPCQTSNLTECQIDSLRETSCPGVSGCSSGNIATCADTASQVFTNYEESSDYICCGLTIGAFVGIMVAILVVIGVIVGVIVYKYKKAQARRQEMEENNQGQNRYVENQSNPYPPPPPPNQFGENSNPYFNQPSHGEGGYQPY